MKADEPHPAFVTRQSRKKLDFRAVEHILTGQQTGGAYYLFESVFEPGTGNRLHVHQREDEVAYVVEGALEVRLEDQTVITEAGSVAYLPKNIPHAIRNPLETTSRYLFMAIPAGLDRWFDALEAARRDGTLDDACIANSPLIMGLNGWSSDMNQIRPHVVRVVPKILLLTLILLLVFGASLASFEIKGVNADASAAEKTIVLYDSASGTIPGAPLLNFIDVPGGAASPSYAEGTTVMDTTVSGKSTYAGWISSGASISEFPLMDSMAGFQVDFTIQLENESHANNNRAGFNVIVLGEDARGIELAFWQNEVWAQNDDATGGLFTHGEGVDFATTTSLIHYQLGIQHNTYTLTADTAQILTGPVRDYSHFDGFPDPYETPNFLFLGDNTTSADARVRLSQLSVTGTEPIAPTTTTAGTPISSPDHVPTETPPMLPIVTAIPTATPPSNVVESCPLSGLLVLLPLAMVIGRRYRRAILPQDFEGA